MVLGARGGGGAPVVDDGDGLAVLTLLAGVIVAVLRAGLARVFGDAGRA